jgi:hypothetical protein
MPSGEGEINLWEVAVPRRVAAAKAARDAPFPVSRPDCHFA